MSVMEVAGPFAALLAEGRDGEAGERFNAETIVSIEAMTGDVARCEGRAALQAKHAWWYENHEVHDARVEGPWPNGDQFLLRFWIDVTPKGGARMQMDEMGLYTVKDGKIVEERFFYRS